MVFLMIIIPLACCWRSKVAIYSPYRRLQLNDKNQYYYYLWCVSGIAKISIEKSLINTIFHYYPNLLFDGDDDVYQVLTTEWEHRRRR